MANRFEKLTLSVVLLAIVLDRFGADVWLTSLQAREGAPGMNKPAAVADIGFEQKAWEFSSQGKFLLVKDPRGLAQIYHPWDVSGHGDFAVLSTSVTVPKGWAGPIYLNLYANDTYVTEGWEQVKPNWTHTYAAYHLFIGHRFKQILIDDQVVWEQDVGDAETFDYSSFDITKHVEPGRQFKLALRVIDKVGSATKLPGDELHLGIWSWQGLGDPDADRKFYTRVFWGDVALSSGAPVVWEENPARKETRLSPISFVAAQPVELATGEFTLDCPNGLPGSGYPVTWGIPFGQGKLLDEGHVSVVDPDGQAVPLQAQVLHKWSDGSVHWLLLDFQAEGGHAGGAYTVRFGTTVAREPATPGLQVDEADGVVSVDTGALSFVVKQGGRALAEHIAPAGAGEPLDGQLTGELVARDGWEHIPFASVNQRVAVETLGPERVTVLCSGRLVHQERVFGRFTCRLHAYRGKPYLRVLYRVFNDTDAPAQLVEKLLLRLKTAMVDGEAIAGGQRLRTDGSETGRLLIRQHKSDAYEVFRGDDARLATGERWAGPITLKAKGHGVAAQVRHFAEQYPKRMWAGQGGQIVLDLFARTVEYEHYVMTRGEAKRHEALFTFQGEGDDADQARAACRTFERPPVLVGPEWYAENGAFGRGSALTAEAFPRMYHWMVERGPPSLVCTVPLGLRNWPDAYSDSVYNAYRGTWQNLYQEIDYGAYIIALLAGRREWLDYAQAYQAHFMDVDICHHHSDGNWVGASYGIAPYHTGSRPYPLNAPLGGLFLLHYLAGDPDAREAAVGIADWLHATNQGVGAGSGRAVGWPLRSSVIAYENTYEEKHLEVATRLAQFALSAKLPRRDVFSETPATWQYRGGIAGMNSILAAGLMRYWRATGDKAVGRTVANIAYNMAYDWMSPTEPGLILSCDPLQQRDLVGYAMQDVLPLFWGYELTGDTAFLTKGAEVMEESVLAERRNGAAFGLSRYWEMQDILYYYGLHKRQAAPSVAE